MFRSRLASLTMAIATIAGQILNKPSLGFRWCFRFVRVPCIFYGIQLTIKTSCTFQFAIAVGVLIILQFFFMPESTFVREPVVPATPLKETDAAAARSDSSEDNVEHKSAEDEGEDGEKTTTVRHDAERCDRSTVAKQSYLSELRLFRGVNKTKSNVLNLLAR
jgi:hypothetical protein